jgi:hypothetical protein
MECEDVNGGEEIESAMTSTPVPPSNQHRLLSKLKSLLIIAFVSFSSLNAQTFTTQFPSDTIGADQAPHIMQRSDGHVMVAFYPPDRYRLLYGEYIGGGWNIASPRLSSERRAQMRGHTTIDSRDRLWCAYRDASGNYRVEVIEGENGRFVGNVGDYATTMSFTGICGDQYTGVWAWNRSALAFADVAGIVRTITIGNTVSLASHVRDTIITAWLEEWNFTGHASGSHGTTSYAAYPLRGRSVLLRKAVWQYQRVDFTFTYWGDESIPQGVGGNGERALYINRYNPNINGKARLDAYIFDDTLHRMWTGVVQPSPAEVAVSNGNGAHVIAWFQSGRLFVKPLLGTVWAVTDSTATIDGDSVWASPSVVVDRDTSVWVAYTAFTLGGRHVFVTHLKPSLTPDRVRSPLAVPRQPPIVKPAGMPAILPNQVQFSWQDDPAVERFRVQVFADSLLAQLLIDTVEISHRRLVINGLQAPRDYYWRVAGVNIDGQGLWSSTAGFTTRVPAPVVCSTPKPDSIMSNPDQVHFRWYRHQDAVRYSVGMSTSSQMLGDPASIFATTSDTLAKFTGRLAKGTYYWHVVAKLTDSSAIPSEPGRFYVLDTTLTEWLPGTNPTTYCVYAPYPNPFNSSTALRIDLPDLSTVKVVVYDLLGRSLETMTDEVLPAGTYNLRWAPQAVASGVYMLRAEMTSQEHPSSGLITSSRVVLVR